MKKWIFSLLMVVSLMSALTVTAGAWIEVYPSDISSNGLFNVVKEGNNNDKARIQGYKDNNYFFLHENHNIQGITISLESSDDIIDFVVVKEAKDHYRDYRESWVSTMGYLECDEYGSDNRNLRVVVQFIDSKTVTIYHQGDEPRYFTDIYIGTTKHSCSASALVYKTGQAATCTADGWKAYYECPTCGKVYQNNYSSGLGGSLGASYTNANAWKTSTAGKIAKLNHNFTTKSTTATYLASAATCTAPATYYYKCASCTTRGTTTYTSGSALGHSWGYAGGSNGTITATCGRVNTHQATLTLTANNANYTGTPYTGASIGNWTGTTAGLDARPNTVTYKQGVTTLTGAPTNAGDYTASITVGTATATKAFKINKIDPSLTAPTANELTYTGEAQELVTAGVASGGTLKYRLDGGEYSENIPTATNANTYTVHYMVVGDENHNDITDSVEVTIDKANAVVTTPPTAITGITFNGEDHALVTEGVASGGTMEYSLDGEHFTDAIPTATDAGTYTVWYKAKGDSNHNDTTPVQMETTVTIARATATAGMTTVHAYLYVSANQKVDIQLALPDEDASYGEIVHTNTDCFTLSPISAQNMITATCATTTEAQIFTEPKTFTIQVTGSKNYEDYEIVVTVEPVPHPVQTISFAADEVSVTFREAYTVTATNDTENTNGPLFGDIKYSVLDTDGGQNVVSVDADTGELTTLKVGTAIIAAQAVMTEQYAPSEPRYITVHVLRKALTDEMVELTNVTYNGTEQSPGITVTDGIFSLVHATDYALDDATTISAVNAGEYSIQIDGIDNYTSSVVKTWKINKANATLDVPTANILTYNEAEQELVTAGANVVGGTLKYRLGNGDYSEEVPTATNAGTYEVWYKVDPDTNYNGVPATKIEVTIAKADSTLTPPTANKLIYNGSAQKLVDAGTNVMGGTLKYSLDGTNYATTIPTATDAGPYTVYYKVFGDDNHKDTQGSVPVTIQKADAEAVKTVQAYLRTSTGETVDIHLPPLPEGAGYGTVNSDNSSYFTLSEIPESIITATCFNNWNDGTDATTARTFTVAVTEGKNYKSYNITVTISPTSKLKQTVAVTDDTMTATYGDTNKSVSATNNTSPVSGSLGTMRYDVTAGFDVVEVNQTTGALTIKKVGTATINAIAEETADHAPSAPEYITVNVNPKAVTVTANNKRAYVGDEVPEIDYTVTGLVGTDELNEGPTLAYAADPDMSKTGTVAIHATGSPDAAGSNYTVSYIDGTLTVVSRARIGGSFEPTYTVIVAATANGTVTSDKRVTEAGTRVNITTTPKAGYALEVVTVTDSKGNLVQLTSLGSGKYQFIMPKSNVTVNTAFVPVAAENPSAMPFVDVAEGTYYYDAVLWAAENSITGGVDATHFAPNMGVTRAHVVTFLWRAAGCPEPNALSSFSDVAADAYYAKAVAWALEAGVTKGTTDTTFSPNMVCTRGQIVTFLYRFNGADTLDIKDNPFVDVAEGAYYYDAVLWAAEKGITGGTTATTFSPSNTCTRGQVVTFLYRYMGK